MLHTQNFPLLMKSILKCDSTTKLTLTHKYLWYGNDYFQSYTGLGQQH
jgi:hypothetical protein